jgi:DNA-binding NarL/FixJ family response regulator
VPVEQVAGPGAAAAAGTRSAAADGLGQPEVAGGGDLTAGDNRILVLLAAGATDDAIGRATGRSMRTVQRRIRELMQLAGAQTRFQLGMAATHRRWV